MNGFLKKDEGSLTLLSLILFMVMFLVGGLAVDMLVFENTRTRLQNLSDRASLAAADLDQTVAPETIVQSYFDKQNLGNYLDGVTLLDGGGGRSVQVDASSDIKTMFMRMVGTTDLMAPASAVATEAAGNVEISLVLDNSGSMGTVDSSDGKTRLEKLKEAVQTFLAVMYPNGTDEHITVSIVPYASQVNAGPMLTNLLNVTAEHSYSDCIEFADADFGSLSLDLTKTYARSAHFDMYSTSEDPRYFKCRPDPEQHVYVMGTDPAVIQSRVDALSSQGWTSLDLGAKWGAALLDPASNPLVQSLIGNPDADVLPVHANRPAAYGDNSTVKALILMTDGINTETQNMAPAYKDGLSDLWSGTGSLSEVYAGVPGLNDVPSLSQLSSWGVDALAERSFYSLALPEGANSDLDGDGVKGEMWWTPGLVVNGKVVIPEQWTEQQVYGTSGTVAQMKWVEVWADMTPEYYADTFVGEPQNDWSAANAFMDALYTPVTPSTKDSRLDTLCSVARDQGLTVYSVGLNVTSHSRDVLKNCATNVNFYLDANSDNLRDKFQAIAESIVNLKLRLVQ